MHGGREEQQRIAVDKEGLIQMHGVKEEWEE